VSPRHATPPASHVRVDHAANPPTHPSPTPAHLSSLFPMSLFLLAAPADRLKVDQYQTLLNKGHAADQGNGSHPSGAAHGGLVVAATNHQRDVADLLKSPVAAGPLGREGGGGEGGRVSTVNAVPNCSSPLTLHNPITPMTPLSRSGNKRHGTMGAPRTVYPGMPGRGMLARRYSVYEA
jgi:hypothetical protein